MRAQTCSYDTQMPTGWGYLGCWRLGTPHGPGFEVLDRWLYLCASSCQLCAHTGVLAIKRTRVLTLRQALTRTCTHIQVHLQGFEVNFDEDVGLSDDSLPVLVSYVQMNE